MIRNISELVSLHPLLAGLPGDVADVVAGCAKTVAFGPERYVLREGEIANALYLLRRGHVALEIQRPAGGPLMIETLGPGAALGWSWLFPPHRWHLNARSLDTVLAIEIDAECLRQKAAKDPEFGLRLMERVSAVILERLQATRYRLIDVYSGVGA